MNRLAFVDSHGTPTVIGFAHNRILEITITESGLVKQVHKVEQLNLNPATIVQEFPDLKGMSIKDIKIEGIKRFYEHLSKLKNEKEMEEYLIDDLSNKHGWKYIGKHKDGFRFQRNKNVNKPV